MHVSREQRDAWNANTRDSPFNIWLREQVTDHTGGLDLIRLRDIAAQYGIDADRYAHLNPGQQRMNIGNRLRKLVPSHVYTPVDLLDPFAARPAVSTATPPEAGTPRAASILPADASDLDLMRLYGEVVDELRARGVVRTGNAPLGDYAEQLFARAFGWSLAANSADGHDATDAAGLRFQIKARRLRSAVPAERQLSTMRALPDARFDMLAGVLFDRHFSVWRAALIPHATVLKRSVYVSHVNGWRFILDDAVWDEAGVRDVTEALTLAQG